MKSHAARAAWSNVASTPAAAGASARNGSGAKAGATYGVSAIVAGIVGRRGSAPLSSAPVPILKSAVVTSAAPPASAMYLAIRRLPMVVRPIRGLGGEVQ